MMLKLPNELLIYIAEICAFQFDSPKHLHALLLTCQRFYLICEPLLLKLFSSFCANAYGLTPLQWAASRNLTGLAEKLISAGIPVNALCDSDTRTPLICAVQKGFSDFVRLLLSHGASEDFTTGIARGYRSKTPLIWAAVLGHRQIVDILIEDGIKVGACTDPHEPHGWQGSGKWVEGDLALMTAAENGHLDVVMRLAELGADCSFEDSDGVRPLFRASQAGADDVVSFLLDVANVDVDHAGLDGTTALHIAVAKKISVVELLLAASANVNARDNLRETPLHLAIRYGEISCVQLLISYGANLEARTKYNVTPLKSSILYCRYNGPKLLLEAGAQADAWDENHYTALHWVASLGDVECAAVLLDFGVNPNGLAKNSTPLHAAQANGHTKMVKLLLDRGADRNVRDDEGRKYSDVIAVNKFYS